MVWGLTLAMHRACAAVPKAQGPGVNSGQFRVTPFASGLNYPSSMQQLSDGSLLVATSDPAAVGGTIFNSTGRLLRFVDANDDGIADGPGVPLATGLVGPVTSVRVANDLVVVAHGASTSCQITLFRTGPTPVDPFTHMGSLAFAYESGWQHETYALAVRPSPDIAGAHEVFFNVGSRDNQPDTPSHVTVGLSGLTQASLQADAIYRMTIELTGGSISVSQPTQVASGLRNAAGIAFHPATGDLYFADNGIDGLLNPSEPLSADELNIVAAPEIGGPIEDFGFADDYIEYRTGTRIGSGAIQPLVAFQPVPSPNGSESEGPNEISFAPANFPSGLNHGVFSGFHGQFNRTGLGNEENPLVYADLDSGTYFHFLSNDEPMLGHPNSLLATADSLFVADLANGNLFGPPYGTGTVYQIRAFAVGDVNFDGAVDIFDVNLVSAHWAETGPQADANGDGIVNIFDVNLISSNWHATGGSATAVPEPASWLMILPAAVGCLLVWTRLLKRA